MDIELYLIYIKNLVLKSLESSYIVKVNGEIKQQPEPAFNTFCAFSCEIMLKLLLHTQGINTRGHDLSKLFDQLSNDSQFFIIKIYKSYHITFIEYCLSLKMNKLFKECNFENVINKITTKAKYLLKIDSQILEKLFFRYRTDTVKQDIESIKNAFVNDRYLFEKQVVNRSDSVILCLFMVSILELILKKNDIGELSK